MDNQLITKKNKSGSKSGAVISFTLGIISIILLPFIFVFGLETLVFVCIIIAIIGLVLGIKSLGSAGKKLSILGITASTVGFLGSVILIIIFSLLAHSAF